MLQPLHSIWRDFTGGMTRELLDKNMDLRSSEFIKQLTLVMSGGRGAEKSSVFLLKVSACLLLCSSLSVSSCWAVEAIRGIIRLKLKFTHCKQ